MKKSLYLPVVLSILFLTSCNQGNPEIFPGKDSSSSESLASVVGLSQQSGAIDSCFARRLFENFKRLYYPKLQEAVQNTDIPTNIWLNKETILSLADSIKLNGYSGARIYFGAYDSIIAGRLSTRQKNSPTIFIVETKLDSINGLKAHYDQFNVKCTPFKLFEPLNHGHLCPPSDPAICKGAYFQ